MEISPSFTIDILPPLQLKAIIFYPLRNLDIINLNRQKLNPYSEFPNNALLNLQINVRSNRYFNHGNDKIE